MQANNPINTHTKFGKERINTFPLNDRKPSVATDGGHWTAEKAKKIHKVMLSDVIGKIFNSHMALYLNIMKAQGFYILLRLFSILSKQTRHSFHNALLP